MAYNSKVKLCSEIIKCNTFLSIFYSYFTFTVFSYFIRWCCCVLFSVCRSVLICQKLRSFEQFVLDFSTESTMVRVYLFYVNSNIQNNLYTKFLWYWIHLSIYHDCKSVEYTDFLASNVHTTVFISTLLRQSCILFWKFCLIYSLWLKDIGRGTKGILLLFSLSLSLYIYIYNRLYC